MTLPSCFSLLSWLVYASSIDSYAGAFVLAEWLDCAPFHSFALTEAGSADPPRGRVVPQPFSSSRPVADRCHPSLCLSIVHIVPRRPPTGVVRARSSGWPGGTQRGLSFEFGLIWLEGEQEEEERAKIIRGTDMWAPRHVSSAMLALTDGPHQSDPPSK